MDQRWEVFAQLRERLLNHVKPLGFIVTKDIKNDAFGSHWVELLKDNKGIWLVWDGKESEYAVWVSQDIHKEPYHMRWHIIEIKPTPQQLPWDQEMVDEVLNSIGAVIESLEI